MRRLLPLAAAVLLPTAAHAAAPAGNKPAGTAAAGKAAAKSVQRLDRAPVNQEVLRVKLPRPSRVVLPNGLTVLILEQHKLPNVAFSLWIRSGALSDPKDRPGLAAAAAALLREGTAKHDSARLAAEIDDVGGDLDASAEWGSDLTRVDGSCLVEHADRLLSLMAELVLTPAYAASELEKYKTRQLAKLQESRASPSFLAGERFRKALYGDHPASVVAPTAESIQALSPEALRAFHARHYVPANAILGVVGDIKAGEAVSLVRQHFGDWIRAQAPKKDVPPVGPAAKARVLLVDRPGSVQTFLVAGDLSLKRSGPDYIPLTVMNRVLGGGPSARLFLNLREEKGYTYGAYSQVTADLYPGRWAAQTPVRTAVTDEALRELFAEFRRIRDEEIPAAELGEAKRSIVAGFALSLESPGALLANAMTVEYYGLPADYWDRYPEEVMGVGTSAARRMAGRYVDLDHLQTVAVGDGKIIEPILKAYGAVEVYDADGKRLR